MDDGKPRSVDTPLLIKICVWFLVPAVVAITFYLVLNSCNSGMCRNGGPYENVEYSCKTNQRERIYDTDNQVCTGRHRKTEVPLLREYSDGPSPQSCLGSCIPENAVAMVTVPSVSYVFCDQLRGKQRTSIDKEEHWEEDAIPNVADTAIRSFAPNDDESKLPFNLKSLKTDIEIHEANCDISLVLGVNVFKYSSEPPLCGSIVTIINHFLKGMHMEFGGSVSEVLDQIKIQSADIDISQEVLSLHAVYNNKVDIISGFFSMQKVDLDVNVFWPTRKYTIRYKGEWLLGDLAFSIAISKEEDEYEISGKFLTEKVTLAKLVSAFTGTFIPSGDVEQLFSSLNLDGLEFSDVSVVSHFKDSGYDIAFDFTAQVQGLGGALRFHLEVIKSGDEPKSVSLAMAIDELHLAAALQQLLHTDISGVPILGGIDFPAAGIVYSSAYIETPQMPSDIAILQNLFHINKGLNFVFKTVLIEGKSPITFYLGVWKGLFEFKIIGSVKPFVKDVLNLVVESTDIGLPQGFDLASILGDALDGLTYDDSSKRLQFPVILKNPIVLIQDILTLQDVKAIFSIRTGTKPSGEPKSSRLRFEAEGSWNISSINALLYTKVSTLESKGFIAEISSSVFLSSNEILVGFSAGSPSQDLIDLLSKIGLVNIAIGDPYLRVRLDTNFAVQASGNVHIGEWLGFQTEVLFGKYANGYRFAFGLVTDFDKGLEKIGAESIANLPGIDILKNTKFCFAVSSSEFQGSADDFESFHSAGLSDIAIHKGAAIAINVKIPQSCSDDFCKFAQNFIGKGASLLLEGSLIFSPLQFKLDVLLKDIKIEILKGLYLTNFGLQLQLQSEGPSFGFQCSLQFNDPPLLLTGMIGMDSNGLLLQLTTKGFFPLIPTVHIIEIGDIDFKANIGASPILLSYLEAGATVRFGLVNNDKAKQIEIAAYVGIGENPLSNFFYGRISNVTIEGLLGAFNFHPQLPQCIADTGFPYGLQISYSAAGKVLQNGIVIPEGFYLNGTLTILWFTVSCHIEASEKALLIDAHVTPFNLANGLIEVGGRSETEGPHLFVDLSWIPPKPPAVLIEGFVSVLGMRILANVTSNMTGTSVYLEGKLWDLFSAHLFVRAAYGSIREAAFEVEAHMQQDLFQVLRENALSALDEYHKKADSAIDAAKAKIEAAKVHWDDAIDKLEDAKQDVNSAKQKFLDASAKVGEKVKDLDKAKADLDYSISKLSDAQASVMNEKKKFDDAVAYLERKKQESCPAEPSKPAWYEVWKWPWYGAVMAAREICLGAFWVAEKAVEAAKGTLYIATGALEVAKGVVAGAKGAVTLAQDALKAVQVVVAESRHILDVANAALTAAQAVVQESKKLLDLAQAALDVAKQVNAFGIKISEALVNVALGGLFDIKAIDFSAKLAMVDKSHISASIEISWLSGAPHRYGITLNLPSVSDMVSAVVDVIKGILGVSTDSANLLTYGKSESRDNATSLIRMIGPHTENLFVSEEGNHESEMSKESAVNSLLEILTFANSIRVSLDVEPSLKYHDKETLLVFNKDSMKSLEAMEGELENALKVVKDSDKSLSEQIQHVKNTASVANLKQDEVRHFSNVLKHINSEMELFQAIKDSNSFLYNYNVVDNTSDISANFSKEIEAEMNRSSHFIFNVSDINVYHALAFTNQSTTYYDTLMKINPNDTEAIRAMNQTINATNESMTNVSHLVAHNHSRVVNMSAELVKYRDRMLEDDEKIAEALKRFNETHSGIKISDELRNWLDKNANGEHGPIERTINIPDAEQQERDHNMMMAILERQLNTTYEKSLPPTDNLHIELSKARDQMQDLLIRARQSKRLNRSPSEVLNEMEDTLSKLRVIHSEIQQSKDKVAAVKATLTSPNDVLDTVHQAKRIDPDLIAESRMKLASTLELKSLVETNTLNVMNLNKAGAMLWMSLLDSTLRSQYGTGLVDLMDVIGEEDKGWTGLNVAGGEDTVASMRKLFKQAAVGYDDNFNYFGAVNSSIIALEHFKP